VSRQANPRVIGAFVVGSLFLTAVGLVLFGSGHWFKERVTVVMYFDGSVNGLDVGAPVKLRGVAVGTVTGIQLVMQEKQRRLYIRVFAELDPSQIYTRGGALTRAAQADREEALRQACKEFGLHARLEMQSLLTGKLFIELNADPTIQARFVEMKDLDEDIVEIPTVPSTSEQVMQVIKNAAEHLGELPMGEILQDARESLAAINRIVNAPEIPQTLEALHSATARLDVLLAKLDAHTDPLLTSARRAAERTARLAETMEHEVHPTAAALREASEQVAQLAKRTAPRLQRLLEHLDALAQSTTQMARDLEAAVRQDSPVRTELLKTLQETRRAARSLREFADYLERHPEALLRGRAYSGR